MTTDGADPSEHAPGPPRLLVGVGRAEEGAPGRDYLVELLAGLAALGVHTQVAVLHPGAVRTDLTTVADVRKMVSATPRSPAGLGETVASWLHPRLQAKVHESRLGPDRLWLQPPDGVHLNGPEAVPLLEHLPTNLPLTTYVHPDDFNIAGLQPSERARLISRTERFLVAEDRAGDDLITNGVEPSRVGRAPDPLIFPLPAVDSSVRAAARSALALPPHAFVIGAPPVPQWVDAPDLTLALAWELERRRPGEAPHTFWYGMPTDADRRWPVEYDIERMGLTSVALRGDLPPSVDLFDVVDVVVLPTHTTAPLPDLFVARAAARGIPVLCWSGDALAEEVRGRSDGVVEQPDVSAMADRILTLAEDADERDRAARRCRTTVTAELERIVPLTVPLP